MSCSLPSRCSTSLAASTSMVCSLSHRRCDSSLSACTAAICLPRFLMVASSGPMFSSSTSLVRLSYLRLRRSTRYIFFSISSLRWRISRSYFSMRRSFSLSSSTYLLRVSCSCVLCASVLSASTRMRAASFSMPARSISFSWMTDCTLAAVLARLRAALLTVVCVDLLAATLSSRARRSRSTVSRLVSIVAICCLMLSCSSLRRCTSPSVWSSDLRSMA
mmetsp:Transcript_51067/g.141351  ORF Transcript_51067/g.141351 Transcript_51067/m.141351 type:complete len:219 (-) Transcript_51067:159-815(-)